MYLHSFCRCDIYTDMGKPKIHEDIVDTIRSLRKSGASIKEIVKKLKLGTGTVSKYSKDIILSNDARIILESKKYPAKRVSNEEKEKAMFNASSIIQTLDTRDIFLILSALYWGEGTKKELNLINGDPELISFFVKGLLSLGVERNRIKISIRYYAGQNRKQLVAFWLNKLALESINVVGFERVESKMTLHKLQYGMCRVRVEKSSYYHKLVTSAIHILSLS